jgi:hypothetical protein
MNRRIRHYLIDAISLAAFVVIWFSFLFIAFGFTA